MQYKISIAGSNLQVYPNPAQEQIQLRTSLKGSLRIVLCDSKGWGIKQLSSYDSEWQQQYLSQ